MPAIPPDPVAEFLVRNLPRALVLGIEEALNAGAQRAHLAAGHMALGHRASALGQQRHFHMAEAFHGALTAGDATPTPLRGNDIVVGQAGIVRLARFNVADSLWANGRRSERRRQLALANAAIETFFQPQLFGVTPPPTEGAAFFVACFSGSLHVQAEQPLSIQIAMPDRSMRYWIFKESIGAFVRRYDVSGASAQTDLAVPTLKRDIAPAARASSEKSGP